MVIVQTAIDILSGILAGISSVLPASPFQSFNAVTLDSELLQFIAWLVPFPQIISLLQIWLTSIAVYYVSMVIMRWIKLIG